VKGVKRMSSCEYICRECGVAFRFVPTVWRRDHVLMCPHCGGIEINLRLDPLAVWHEKPEERRFVRREVGGGAAGGAGR
jgi:DNA-directed RNA polymerase subunit RPC12/RpoP